MNLLLSHLSLLSFIFSFFDLSFFSTGPVETVLQLHGSTYKTRLRFLGAENGADLHSIIQIKKVQSVAQGPFGGLQIILFGPHTAGPYLTCEHRQLDAVVMNSNFSSSVLIILFLSISIRSKQDYKHSATFTQFRKKTINSKTAGDPYLD